MSPFTPSLSAWLQQLCKKSPCILLAVLLLPLNSFAACPSWPTETRFSLNGAEATDLRTGLVWKRCTEGQTWNGNTCVGSALEMKHETALKRAQAANPQGAATGWRLPNINELFSLADKGCENPSIDSKAFPDNPMHIYWSSTPYAAYPANVWIVAFDVGVIGPDFGFYDLRPSEDGFAARLVRSAQ